MAMLKRLTVIGFKETVADGAESTVLVGKESNKEGTVFRYTDALPVNTTINLIPGEGATAKIEFSLSPYSELVAETAVWQDWDSGSVAVQTTDTLIGNISALRMETTGGPSTWEVR